MLRRFLSALWIAGLWTVSVAAEVRFVPEELFRIPFGPAREALGAKVENDYLVIPHEFTIDVFGRFYINDLAKHRVVRYSPAGAFEMAVTYDPSVRQVFAHADENGNLWLLLADPKAVYYGVHSPKGKAIRSAVFSQYNRFRLHVADGGETRVLFSHDAHPAREDLYRFEAGTHLIKRDRWAAPPEGHHRVGRSTLDRVPSASTSDADQTYRLTDPESGKQVEVQGRVVYVTSNGDIYARLGARDLRLYGPDGRSKGRLRLGGLEATGRGIRFDAQGNIYQLDGIPDRSPEDARALGFGDPRADPEDRRYSSEMPGLRMIRWTRR